MALISEQVDRHQTTLFLSGRFDFLYRKTFNLAIAKAQLTNPPKIVLNFSQVFYINSAGLGMLMVALKQLKADNICLVLEVPPGYVMDVLNLTHIGGVIPISPIPVQPAFTPTS